MGKRAGRPWAPARCSSVEMTQLVGLVRSWLDETGISIAGFHDRITEDHFRDRTVPSVRRLRDLLGTDELTWELVEAVADVCHPDESAQAGLRRREAAMELWEAARQAPTSAEVLSPILQRKLLEAKDQTIAAYQEMERLRQAYMASESSRQQALQAAVFMLALLGRAQAEIARLSRKVDVLTARSSAEPTELAEAEERLQRATEQERGIRTQLLRAERERDTAQQLADHAARRIQVLEEKIARLEAESVLAGDAGPEVFPAQEGANGGVPDAASDDDVLDDADRALHTIRMVLDQEHEAVIEAAEDLGLQVTAPFVGETSATTIPGETVAGSVVELSRTTPENLLPADLGRLELFSSSETEVSRLRYVGAATRRISRGMDLDEIVLGLCRSVVPAFADAILVYLRDPLPVGDEQPVEPLVLRLRRTDWTPERALDLSRASKTTRVRIDGSLADVLRGVRPLFADMPLAAEGLEELVACETPTGRRALLAPMRGRRRVIGVAVMLRQSDSPAFEDDDLLAAAQLVSQAALGVDKVVLSGREGYIADQLQRAMLPDRLPQPDGVQLSSRYLPAAESARLGGDWYDAIPLSAGRVALAVGDVMGHSMQSAAVMGQLRTAVQTMARLDLPPHEVLHRLDEQAHGLGHDRMATCVYAVYDPIAHRLAVANAGHLPPVMLYTDGRTEVLQVPEGAPIGVGGVPFTTVELPAPVGATLLLYTDGLVESRFRDVWTGIERLQKQMRAIGSLGCPPLETLCDEVLNILDPGDRDDDVALLAARFDGIADTDADRVVHSGGAPRPH